LYAGICGVSITLEDDECICKNGTEFMRINEMSQFMKLAIFGIYTSYNKVSFYYINTWGSYVSLTATCPKKVGRSWVGVPLDVDDMHGALASVIFSKKHTNFLEYLFENE